ncbi:MAG: cupin domain-containing protein [Actinomycetota bacterium]
MTPNDGPVPGKAELEKRFAQEGLAPKWWGNAPGDTYDSHTHSYHKVLYCASGSITFHTDDGDFELHEGDRLDVEPDTPHAAGVGPEGVRCVEAARR